VARSGGPVAVELLVRVVSPNALTSPLTGTQAAALRCELVEIVEREGAASALDGAPFEVAEVALGGLVLSGELLVVADVDGDELSLIARRARFELARPPGSAVPLGEVPPELAPLLRNATGCGTMAYRELALRTGDKLRLRAIVEASRTLATEGDRHETRLRYIARDDLGAVVIEDAPW
jgi:hypothetical protein